MIEIALFQPDIAPNAATIMRMCACFGLKVRIIEPAGFTWSDTALKRAGMDYLAKTDLSRDTSWESFQEATIGRRLLLMSTRASLRYTEFRYAADDILLLGRESAGVPDSVHAAATERLLIPLKPGFRSLNVAMACAMVTGEALRQLGGFASR
jgi:tRNA (cytidine/uridine-2'-O-)-methyltransferase